MKRHAVPQNVMDIEFKLFGAFSVKQFSYIIVCIIIALFIYSLPLPDILKWPLIIFFVILGFALALLTVNGIPFSSWLSNFVIALTTSQRRIWKKVPKTPEVLRSDYQASGKYATHLVSRAEKVNMPLLNESIKDSATKVDELEEEHIATIDTHIKQNYKPDELNFTKIPIDINMTNTKVTTSRKSPIINPRELNLAMSIDLNDPNITTVKTGDNQAVALKMNKQGRINRPIAGTNLLNNILNDMPVQDTLYKEQVPKPSLKNMPIPKQQDGTSETVSEKVKMPVSLDNITKSDSEYREELGKQEKIKNLKDKIFQLETELSKLKEEPEEELEVQSLIVQQIDTINKEIKDLHQRIKDTNQKFDQSTKLSVQPTLRPNILNGFVIDKNNNPIPGVSIEVRDSEGFPVRKTVADNSGRFTTATPLPDGDYILDFEKPGRKFTDYRIKLNGKVIPTYKFMEQ